MSSPTSTIRQYPPRPADVQQILFASRSLGFAFDPGLYLTRDGAKTWHRVATDGEVLGLTVAGTRLVAVVGPCPHDTCYHARIEAGPASTGRLTPVPNLPDISPGGSPSWLPNLPITQRHGDVYLLAQSAHVTLWRDHAGGWTRHRTPCLNPSGESQLLAPYGAHNLGLICLGEPGVGQQEKWVYSSTDDGVTWHLDRAGNIDTSNLGAGYGDGLAILNRSTWLLAADRCCIMRSTDGGHDWATVESTLRDTFNDGMSFIEFPAQGDTGYALPADDTAHWIAITHNAGRTWHRQIPRPK